MLLETYFAQSDKPSKNSPVGVLMVRVLAKNPGMDFEQARQEAYSLLDRASRRRVYNVPAVYSVEEEVARKAKMLARFSRSGTVERAA
jgi:hypothetical protein